ncbi:hypothetical protein [Catenovulum maritimum]|uniref:Uncharacterized protein n=1 Tax=Catenovulum maritimum TaxID=1513271 RepID=A0A0J8GWY0_9ALTE|nr:hypothetical protein [Catenovulum maritimum]KMT65203.1 hypothetical protein XM47_10750 [Catenovulum maritimum]
MKLTIKSTLLLFTVFLNGCASMVDVGLSQAEVPTLENNINRTIIGLTLVKTGNAIENMPISADAEWPKALDAEISEQNRALVDAYLDSDPFVSTNGYSITLQENTLGGYAFASPAKSPLMYQTINKLAVLYGNDVNNWPQIFELDNDFSNYNKFKMGQVKKVQALNSNIYLDLSTAVINLMPVNFQKDLSTLKYDMTKSNNELALLKANESEIEQKLKDKVDAEGNTLADSVLADLKSKMAILEVEISEIDTIATEREDLYLAKLDEAVEVLKADIKLSEEQIGLAKNIKLATKAIKHSAYQAGGAFTLALTNIGTKGCYQNLPKELGTLVQTKLIIPAEKQGLLDERMKRLSLNAVYAVPAIGIGSYYAVKQVLLANKYQEVADVILDADEAQKALEAEQVANSELANKAN